MSRIDTVQPLCHNYGRFCETANSPPPSLFNNRLTKGFLRHVLKSQRARFALIIETPPRPTPPSTPNLLFTFEEQTQLWAFVTSVPTSTGEKESEGGAMPGGPINGGLETGLTGT